MYKKIFLINAVLLLLINCGGGGGGNTGDSDSGGSGSSGNSSADLDALIQEAADNTIIPAATRFSTAMEALVNEVEDFCIEPSTTTLDVLQAQWLVAQEAWFRLAAYNFGPLNADIVFPEYTFIDSMRLRGTNYLSSVRDDVKAVLISDSVLDADYFSSKTFDLTGLLALEVLLYESSDDQPLQELSVIVDEYLNEPRRCEFLTGHAEILSTRASEVSDAWQNTYRDTFISGELDDGSDSIAVLIISMQNYLDYLHGRGVVSITAQVSMQNWASLASAVSEIEAYLEGTGEYGGVFAAMTANGGTNVDAVRANLVALVEAVNDQNVNALEVALQSLDGNLKREVPTDLDVELGITFSDGD